MPKNGLQPPRDTVEEGSLVRVQSFGAKAPPILAAYVRAKARTLPTFSLFSKNDPNAIALPGNHRKLDVIPELLLFLIGSSPQGRIGKRSALELFPGERSHLGQGIGFNRIRRVRNHGRRQEEFNAPFPGRQMG